LRYAGGPLGGNFNYFRPEAGIIVLLPLAKKLTFAVNFDVGEIIPFGAPYQGQAIPYYDRYRMGGEKSLRGFEWYSVIPRKKDGTYFTDAAGVQMGGDRYFQINLEYQIRLASQLKFIMFSDIGNTYFETQGWDLSLIRFSYGAEVRVTLPMFQAPLRFIYGVNPHPFFDEKHSNFQFSIGSMF